MRTPKPRRKWVLGVVGGVASVGTLVLLLGWSAGWGSVVPYGRALLGSGLLLLLLGVEGMRQTTSPARFESRGWAELAPPEEPWSPEDQHQSRRVGWGWISTGGVCFVLGLLLELVW